jgi:uncharacterized membrane protein
MAALAAGALLTFSLQSHPAAATLGPGLIWDWLHMSAMSAWLGGLLPLAFVLRADRSPDVARLSRLVPRFSLLAICCVAILALTGLANSLVEVGTFAALTGTVYGLTIVVKAGLLSILVELGAINLLILSPRLRSSIRARQWLRRVVRLEMVLGLATLLAASLLASAMPANQALAEHDRQGIIQTAHADQVDMILRIMPGLAGNNALAVDVDDQRPGAGTTPARVLLRLSMPEHSHGGAADAVPTEVEATSVDGRRFTAEGGYLAMATQWTVEVVVRRAGFNDVTKSFVFMVHGQ